ncbi:nucleotidyltransferase family protein [Natrarchaeobius chitinivorans]|uniref:Nucleotidyltransferase family protein n=1 Tax=Natrarchaeobius chitinivorans TaxID=1679083 RepID=A0A3N6LZZ7_NATCH|nr:nucleotidyltransferase family protein [Natrarchaeobius chitinivorans]RQG96528.1 nucleotidyltransferase family protein [Natrarchaeobius chitinivorans]
MGELVGVLLAGGMGTRYEEGNKLLATVPGDDEPIVRRAARSLETAVDYTVAVLGYESDAVARTITGAVDETVYNPDYEQGQSTSVRAGARTARKRGADAAVFLPGDMPCVDRTTVDRIATTHRETDSDVVLPTTDGQRGNPVLFDSAMFDELLELSGDTGGRVLFDDADVRRIDVADAGIHVDVDTVADRDRLDCNGDTHGSTPSF